MTDVTPQLIAVRIELALSNFGESKNAARARSQISQHQIKNLRDGHWPTLRSLVSIAEKLGISVAALLEPASDTGIGYPTLINAERLRHALAVTRSVMLRMGFDRHEAADSLEATAAAQIYRLLEKFSTEGKSDEQAADDAADTAEAVLAALAASIAK
jgi:hypothetical protein